MWWGNLSRPPIRLDWIELVMEMGPMFNWFSTMGNHMISFLKQEEEEEEEESN